MLKQKQIDKIENILEENCFNYQKNRFNLFELFFAMIGSGTMPKCPCCNQDLITNEMIRKSASMSKLKIFTVEDLADNMNDAKVQAFVKSAIEVEHILAQSIGGTNHYANLALMHPNCNKKKGIAPAIIGVNQAKDAFVDEYVYIAKGLGIHIYDIMPCKKEIPEYICSEENNNLDNIAMFLKRAFTK